MTVEELVQMEVTPEKVVIKEEVLVSAPIQIQNAEAPGPQVQSTTLAQKKPKAPFTPLSELSKVATTETATMQKPKAKVTIHGPEDPMDALLCEGCQ